MSPQPNITKFFTKKDHENKPQPKITKFLTNKKNIKCFKCNRQGHYANRCWQKKPAPANPSHIIWGVSSTKDFGKVIGSFKKILEVIFFLNMKKNTLVKRKKSVEFITSFEI